MINYKDIELSDKKLIDACLTGNTYRACDFSFANLYSWNAKFKTQFDVKNQTLFLRFTESDGYMYYMMPIGHMNLKCAIEEMMEDAKANNIPFRMKGITLRMWDDIKAVMPDRFEYIHDRNNDEYLYLSEKLIKLSGKKLQSKRNHINRFKADNPDWEYFPIFNQHELDECVEMLDKWDKVHEDKDRTLKYDYIATRKMLDNFHALKLKGGAIRVNGKIVAFTIGEKLTEDTFVVHVEKAFSEINGAYTIINQQFIEHEATKYTYVNREEDMGLESLRKAKSSYYPDILLQEAILIPKV
ncbi:DUF2156 domain-containing protein [Dysgonomonas sp. 520]|uniref:DUF2156 domain-containing protein n=1 Tax=Dysgonomonas sp. 520 TaxID=2302931 RepID=UPI0013CFEA2D|nr:phosphatidylglycerol lysyltransferase domain-containing protein [Dysgonomonas sp. 520]NDW08090.1 DUF2156 domain-containing protein [Dysgonomonas sp. 520]